MIQNMKHIQLLLAFLNDRLTGPSLLLLPGTREGASGSRVSGVGVKIRQIGALSPSALSAPPGVRT